MTDVHKTFPTKFLADFVKKHSARDKITFVKAVDSFNWALLEIIVKFFTGSLCLPAVLQAGLNTSNTEPPSPP